jgi:tRNA(Arg) A34 adenosine deaminase TadA
VPRVVYGAGDPKAWACRSVLDVLAEPFGYDLEPLNATVSGRACHKRSQQGWGRPVSMVVARATENRLDFRAFRGTGEKANTGAENS